MTFASFMNHWGSDIVAFLLLSLLIGGILFVADVLQKMAYPEPVVEQQIKESATMLTSQEIQKEIEENEKKILQCQEFILKAQGANAALRRVADRLKENEEHNDGRDGSVLSKTS